MKSSKTSNKPESEVKYKSKVGLPRQIFMSSVVMCESSGYHRILRRRAWNTKACLFAKEGANVRKVIASGGETGTFIQGYLLMVDPRSCCHLTAAEGGQE